MTEANIIAALISVIGALATAVAFLVWRSIERSEARGDVRDLRDEGRDRDHHTTRERIGDKQAAHGETLATIRADINALKTDSERCDKLETDVEVLGREMAVVKDFKARAEVTFADVEHARRELTSATEQIRTLFSTISDLKDSVSQIHHMLMNRQQNVRAVNGG